MKYRCIMVFPNFRNINLIEDIREKYDPLYSKVKPHITLVFPFLSDISGEQLEEYIKGKICDLNPFKLSLSGISIGGYGYIFLNVIEGNSELFGIHNRLYEGLLRKFYPSFLKSYTPHMTVGRIMNPDNFEAVINSLRDMNEVFEDEVNEISVEIIDEDENSLIEMSVKIGNLRASASETHKR